MSYKIPEHGAILFPLVSNETSKIKQNPMQGSLHDDFDAVTLTALRAEFLAAIQERHTEIRILFTLFLKSSPQGSHDRVPFIACF
jgi:hypothetical protein